MYFRSREELHNGRQHRRRGGGLRAGNREISTEIARQHGQISTGKLFDLVALNLIVSNFSSWRTPSNLPITQHGYVVEFYMSVFIILHPFKDLLEQREKLEKTEKNLGILQFYYNKYIIIFI